MKKNLVLALMLAGTTTAFAQQAPSPAPPAPQPQAGPPAGGGGAPMTDDEKKAKAKALYEQGLSHYNLGEFDSAIVAFKDAYAISQAPGLLFNIAQSFRLKKDYEQATYFYTTYLRLKPDAPNRSDVEERLKEMDELIKQQESMKNAPPIGPVNPEGGTVTTTTTTGTTGTTTTGTGTDKPTGDSGGMKAESLITAGYATAGAGAALVITGFIFGGMAKSNEKDLNALSTNMGTWSQDAQDKYDAGKRDNTIAIISFVAGGAAIATGGTLWFLGTQKKNKQKTVAVIPTPHGTTVTVGWSF